MVLTSTTAFQNHYATRVPNVWDFAKSAAKGGIAASGMTGVSSLAVGTFVAQTSAWSTFAGWPLIGSFAAGKATAAGVAAGLAAAGSAAVIVPALAVGGGVAYVAYKKRKAHSLQCESRMSDLADAFARVASLPMMALAISMCHANPANVEPVGNFVLRELGAWGYAEEYIRDGFAEAMKYTPAEINGHYNWAMNQLEAGTTEGIGATPKELPARAVRDFAEEFKRKMELCVG